MGVVYFAASMNSPLRRRWQPVRGGLINLFKYEDQVFRYENGHLLLRGDNGSGKSRVLALQLPFLLDGDLSPYRVEPDRDPAKRIEWHLLMGGKYDRRTGYTWLEFGRLDEDGAERYLTLGCGMEARKGGGAPERWFFISPRRVGDGLALVQHNTPLTKRQLANVFADADGKAGVLFNSKGKYRSAVDDALFKLGSRFDPLVDLLVQLRQPQLMRDMREEVLSEALSEALPPVAERLIAEVAESFQGLDADRQRTDEYRQMLDSVESFRDGYRQYLAVAVRRLCSIVRGGHSQYEHAARELRGIEEEKDRTARSLAEARSRHEEASARLAACESELATLRESPELRDKRELDIARSRAEECRAEEESARREAETAAADYERAREEYRRRENDLQKDTAALVERHTDLQRRHRPLATRREQLFDRETDEPTTAERDTGRFVEGLRRNIRHLETRNNEVERERRKRETARDRLEQARDHEARAKEAAESQEKHLAALVDQFGTAAAEWEESLQELTPELWTRNSDWATALAERLETDDHAEEFAFHRDLAEAHRRTVLALSDQRANRENARQALHRDREEVSGERDRLRDGEQPVPPAPHTRESRPADRPGAPFWRCFEFRPEIPEEEHASFEAALESAGLLDAWIYPDGRIDVSGHADVFLAAADEPTLPRDASLASILKPADDDESPPVAAILDRIGNHRDAGRCWITRDGSWANGSLHGRWSKPDADYLGHRAREAARQRRLAELEQTLQELDEGIAAIEAELAALRERDAVLQREVASAPSTRPAEDAATTLAARRDELQRRNQDLIAADDRMVAVQRSLDEATEQRDRDAADLGLGDWADPARLAEFSDKLADFEKRAAAFWPLWSHNLDLHREFAAAREREKTTHARREAQSQKLRARKEASERARSRFNTLRETVGAGVEEIMRRLAAAEEREAANRREVEARQAEIHEAEKKAAVLEERLRAARERRESAEASRNRAVERMGAFVSHRLFEELDPTSQPDRDEFSATAAVDLARRFERELKEHPEDDDHWNRLQSAIAERFNEFSDQLGRNGPFPRMERIDENSVCVVRGEFQGNELTVRQLRDAFSAELANRQRIFEEEERKVIENHLIGEAAVAVRDRIRAGDDWVRNVNEELARVPTSSGIRLKFEWRLADPDDLQLKSVREFFRKHAATWTPAEREEIGSFLQNRIRASREEDDSRTWRDHLQHALDYRGWHRFGILRKKADDESWKRLTRRSFGTGSGGEKALTLTVPQFAAAAAHYHSAHPHAPRLILLDEVFVGIDANTRSRLMGLLETFDLDYVMTSEREWGAFPTVSALAIYQLSTRPEFDAVAVTRWIWNGSDKQRDEGADEERSTTLLGAEA